MQASHKVWGVQILLHSVTKHKQKHLVVSHFQIQNNLQLIFT